MKYKEFITEMEKIGWHKTIFYGHVSSIQVYSFNPVLENKLYE